MNSRLAVSLALTSAALSCTKPAMNSSENSEQKASPCETTFRASGLDPMMQGDFTVATGMAFSEYCNFVKQAKPGLELELVNKIVAAKSTLEAGVAEKIDISEAFQKYRTSVFEVLTAVEIKLGSEVLGYDPVNYSDVLTRYELSVTHRSDPVALARKDKAHYQGKMEVLSGCDKVTVAEVFLVDLGLASGFELKAHPNFANFWYHTDVIELSGRLEMSAALDWQSSTDYCGIYFRL
jgi:hypothetical protein